MLCAMTGRNVTQRSVKEIAAVYILLLVTGIWSDGFERIERRLQRRMKSSDGHRLRMSSSLVI